jgi:hypothetical protein
VSGKLSLTRRAERWITRSSATAAQTSFVDVFTCRACDVTPELVTDGGAQLAIVRHQLGCPTLMAQTRTRWPAQVR